MADISILQLPPTTYVTANDVTVVVQGGITKKVAASVFQGGVTGPQGPAGPQGPQGIAGTPGAAGAQGPAGPGGPQGATGATGAQGPVGATGPQGPQGPQGTSATATAGSTSTGSPGSSASVVNVGTTSAAVFNFTIPRGDQGPSGPIGPAGPGVAPGGTAGQVLIKQSGIDYATAWGNVTGGLSYQGSWNASANTPTLTSSVGSNGNYYIVSVAGSTNLNGITDWQIGDWAIFNGSVWQKIDQTNTVTSVNGQTGAVSLAYADLAGAIPTWNQNTTGTAANVTGVVAVINGGTGASTAATARTNLGSTTVGGNFFTLTNPSAITFPRINADNTVSALDAATFRTAIGAGTSSTTGTVTSVSGTGTVSGLTLTGTVTTSGSLTLGGTLAVTPSNFSSQTANTFLAAPNGSAGVPSFRAVVAADIPTLNQNTTGTAANVTGVVAVANGGSGATTFTAGYLKANGTTAFSTVTQVPTTDLSGTITNAQLANSTISGVSLGSSLFALTIGSGLSGTSYNGSAAITITNSLPMVYPGSGIPNSTGSSWGTSYSTSGSGNVVLTTGATLSNPTIGNYEIWTGTSAPSYAEGRQWYDSASHALAYYNDSATSVVHIGQDLILKVINNTGSTIANGSPVYITSTSSGQTYPNIALAKADVAATSSVIGLTNGAIANGSIGYVTSQGGIDGVNTGTFTVGQVLYLSPYSAGQLMNTIPPTGITVQVGVVSYVDSSVGKIYVKQTTPLAVPASIITGQVAIANGGTGQSTQAAAITALTGTQTSGYYLRSNGTNSLLSAIQAADVPTLNQNTTGTAANVTGIVAIANGGTNSTATPTAGGAGYGTGTAHAYTAAGTAGQVLTSAGSGAPVWSGISGGTF